MNKKQKIALISGISIILLSLIIWQIYGGEIFTKTEVLVEVEDELFGTTKEWREQFVWGLDLSGIISAISLVCSGILVYIFRTKK
jgi:hypothetical protein